MGRRDYQRGGGYGYRAEEGERRMRPAKRWDPMGGPIRWGSDGENEVYCDRCWSRVAVGGGGESVTGCWEVLTPGDRQEGERDLH